MTEKVKVVFRKDRDGSIIAIFPQEPWFTNHESCKAYKLHGWWFGATIESTRETTRPTREETKALYDELVSRGNILKVVTKITYKDQLERKAKIASKN